MKSSTIQKYITQVKPGEVYTVYNITYRKITDAEARRAHPHVIDDDFGSGVWGVVIETADIGRLGNVHQLIPTQFVHVHIDTIIPAPPPVELPQDCSWDLL